jgi:hypothetical protein
VLKEQQQQQQQQSAPQKQKNQRLIDCKEKRRPLLQPATTKTLRLRWKQRDFVKTTTTTHQGRGRG